MMKITVLTATRAEYGLLSPIIHALMNDMEFEVGVVVTGAHLSSEFGLTYREIEQDGVEIQKKIEILLSADTAAAISKSMGLALISFADYFEEYRPDALMVLGDRYETLAVCCAAMNARIPIIHLYGGETTEGAVDEAIRHAITKLAYLHFTSTEEYRRRVIQLGENPDRVFAVGAIGIENILKKELLKKEELEESLGRKLHRPYAVVTFQPVTLEAGKEALQCGEMLAAFDHLTGLDYIMTKANADNGGREINRMLEQYAQKHSNAHLYDSLGSLRYLSLLKYADLVVGNSSSGLVEAPSFQIPTVNIGDRQRGRLKADSVIDCRPEKKSILEAMEYAMNQEFRINCKNMVNPYGDGHTTDKIMNGIRKVLGGEVDLKKKFYDIQMLIDEKSIGE